MDDTPFRRKSPKVTGKHAECKWYGHKPTPKGKRRCVHCGAKIEYDKDTGTFRVISYTR